MLYIYGYSLLSFDEIFPFINNRLKGMVMTRSYVDEMSEEAKNENRPFDRAKALYLVDYHRGTLPLEICAVPENYKGVPFITIVNTDPNCSWLLTDSWVLFPASFVPTAVKTKEGSWTKVGKVTPGNKGGIFTVDPDTHRVSSHLCPPADTGLLRPIFRNGKLLVDENFRGVD